MVVPATYAVTILVDDVDVTQYVPFDSLSLDDYARQVSTLRMRIENPSGVTPARLHEVKVKWNADDSIRFLGYIMELKTSKRDNGITVVYDCECADRKILLQRTVIGGNEFEGSDIDILDDLLTNAYPDLSTLFDFATDVTSIADGLDFPVEDGTNLLDALNDLADLSDADFRFETVEGGGTLIGTVDFDGGYAGYTLDAVGFTASEQTGGNPDNAYIGTKTNPADDDYIEVAFNLAQPIFITDFVFDMKNIVPGGVVSGDMRLGVYFDNVRVLNLSVTPNEDWVTKQWSVNYTSFDITNSIVADRFAVRLYVEDATPTAGSWTFGFDNIKVYGRTDFDVITFDPGGESYTVVNSGATDNGEVGLGYDGNAYAFEFDAIGQTFGIKHDLGSDQSIAGVGCHAKISSNIGTLSVILLDADDVEIENVSISPDPVTTGDWSFRGTAFDPPVTARKIQVQMTSLNTITGYYDNVAWILAAASDNTSNLQWDETPDLADFNIDVQLGDEYASDIEFSIGSLDDFNSVTVIGGYEEIAIDKALDNDGGRDHIALPYPVKSLAVYTNSGTDTTPAWGSALALGAWGSDTLTGDGGDKDVLLDNVHNVLFFDTAPPNMVNSYRITGTIQRPIRVRVEDVAEDELTLATSYNDETITSVDQAVAIGAALLEQKDSVRHLNFKTDHPGLKAGQSITVTDSARGLEETVTIRRISTTWLGSSGHASFDVECGDDDISGIDAMVANTSKAVNASGAVTSPDTQTAYILTVEGSPLTVNGQPLYYIA